MLRNNRSFAIFLSFAFAFITFIGSHTPVSALEVPPTPTDIPIVDTTGTLSSEQKTTLANSIADSRSKTSNQIAILMIPSLENRNLIAN